MFLWTMADSTHPLFSSTLNLFRSIFSDFLKLGVFQRPLILLQKYRDTNGSRIVIQIVASTTFCQEKSILLQKYRDRNGRCIAILFKSIGVRGRFNFLIYNQHQSILISFNQFVISVVLQKLFVKHIFINILFTLKLLVAL